MVLASGSRDWWFGLAGDAVREITFPRPRPRPRASLSIPRLHHAHWSPLETLVLVVLRFRRPALPRPQVAMRMRMLAPARPRASTTPSVAVILSAPSEPCPTPIVAPGLPSAWAKCLDVSLRSCRDDRVPNLTTGTRTGRSVGVRGFSGRGKAGWPGYSGRMVEEIETAPRRERELGRDAVAPWPCASEASPLMDTEPR